MALIPIAVRMGQIWTDKMQAELERWQASPDKAEATSTTATGLETLHVSDVLRGLAAYCVAVIRNYFLCCARPVWSLAQAIDYAGFCRRLGEPLAAVIGSRTKKDYVVRPWTEEENADFERLCASLDANPIKPGFDPDSVEILTIDPWYDVDLPRA